MSKKTPQAPAAPDYGALVQAQGAANKDALQTSAQLNAMNTYGPSGSTTYQFGNRGDLTNVPISQTTTLTPQGQYIYDTQQGISTDLTNRARDALAAAPNTPFTLAGTPYDPRSYDTSALQPYSAVSAPRPASVWGGPLPQPAQHYQGQISAPTPWGSSPTSSSSSSTAPQQPNPSMLWGGTSNVAGQQSGSPVPQTQSAPAGGLPPDLGARPALTPQEQQAVNFSQMPFFGQMFSGLPVVQNAVQKQQAQAAWDTASNNQTAGIWNGSQFVQPGAQQPASGQYTTQPSNDYSPTGPTSAQAQVVPYQQPQAPAGYSNIPGSPTVLPYDPSSYGNIDQINQQAADTMYANSMRQMQPTFDLQKQRLTNDLENRGIPVGSAAYARAMDDMARQQNDAMSGASAQSYMQGHQVAGDTISQEQSLRAAALGQSLQLHNQDNSDYLQRLQTEQGLRSQVINEDQMVRNQGINDASLYLQGAPALGMPQAPTVPTYNMNPVDTMAAANLSYQGQMNQYQAAQQQNQSLWAGVGNVAKAGAAIWSSAVLKENIGDAESFLSRAIGLKMRSWNYTEAAAAHHGLDTHKHIGPLAEEFSEAFGGPRSQIHLGDALFCLWKAVQELAAKVEENAHVRAAV